MKELDDLQQYVLSESSEKAKDYLVFPLFKKLFGKKFSKETDAAGADIYIEGQLVVELKTSKEDFLQGFYQALHYEKKGLTFSAICVISNNFIGVWKVSQIPAFAKKLATNSDPIKSASEIGRINANKTKAYQRKEIINSSIYHNYFTTDDELFGASDNSKLHQFVQVLRNLDSDRIQIRPSNFIQKIELLKQFFDDPIDAIHCFYAIVGYWDVTSKVIYIENQKTVHVLGYKGERASENINIKIRQLPEFKKFVEGHYVFTNEGSGLTVDYYFSRFDEVITKINPEYAIQHGIFFTDNNLSKFALWYVHTYYEKKLSDKYIVFDPAGGSGNLVTSWKGHLKHKIVSELQPDLLRTIERRMELDPEQVQPGFTIIPKTSESRGLNFLDKSAEDYIIELMNELNSKNLKLDKPIAFLLNPPYKNTDENIQKRTNVDATYGIDPTILEITGNDAGKERYLAFLGQILNLAKIQMEDMEAPSLSSENITLPEELKAREETPLIMIFTPTSWLIPRPTYKKFRKVFDKYFKYEDGFIFVGSEFFKIKGKFPISFTIWRYNYDENGNKNVIKIRDLTFLKKKDLDINWSSSLGNLSLDLKEFINKSQKITFDVIRGDIRTQLPSILNVTKNEYVQQPRYDYSTAKKDKDKDKLVSGFPKKATSLHFGLKRVCGSPKGDFVGFYDNNTPVRILQDNYDRMSTKPDRIWFRLDNDIKGSNKTKIFSGAPDNRGYAANDIASAETLFSWFSITKATNGRYPLWANQFDIWPPEVKDKYEKYYYSLCFAFGLSENRCVVTKFEEDNPVKGAPEVFVDNPMCPTNPESFWSTVLDEQIVKKPTLAKNLVDAIKELYDFWNMNYCKGQILTHVGLQDEAYFKYFDYADFLTPYSGLIQIRRYAEINSEVELLNRFDEINSLTKDVKEKIYDLLVNELGYFE